MVHMCKMIISTGFFLLFCFFWVRGVKEQKIAQNEKKKNYIRQESKMTKYSVRHARYLRDEPYII